MQPVKNKDNKVGDSNSSSSLSEEADELARGRKWTRHFALYVMFCQAMSVGDKIRAEACMNLLEREGINSLVDPVFGKPQKENDKSGETESHSP
jgi:hypothetical protein